MTSNRACAHGIPRDEFCRRCADASFTPCRPSPSDLSNHELADEVDRLCEDFATGSDEQIMIEVAARLRSHATPSGEIHYRGPFGTGY